MDQLRVPRRAPFGKWTDLWTTACGIDYKLEAHPGESARSALLASDDGMELSLRRMSSWIYLKRTGDTAGALRMLGPRATGVGLRRCSGVAHL